MHLFHAVDKLMLNQYFLPVLKKNAYEGKNLKLRDRFVHNFLQIGFYCMQILYNWSILEWWTRTPDLWFRIHCDSQSMVHNSSWINWILQLSWDLKHTINGYIKSTKRPFHITQFTQLHIQDIYKDQETQTPLDDFFFFLLKWC